MPGTGNSESVEGVTHVEDKKLGNDARDDPWVRWLHLGSSPRYCKSKNRTASNDHEILYTENIQDMNGHRNQRVLSAHARQDTQRSRC